MNVRHSPVSSVQCLHEQCIGISIVREVELFLEVNKHVSPHCFCAFVNVVRVSFVCPCTVCVL